MLNLRPDWHRYPVGANAAELAEQVEAGPLRVEFWRHILRATFDGMVAGWTKKNGCVVTAIEEPRLTWQINDAKFVFLSELSYDGLQDCAEFTESASIVTIVTPPRRDILARKILSALLGNRVSDVWAVDTYLSYRALMDEADFRLTRKEVLYNLLGNYNDRVAQSAAAEALTVEMPCE